MKKLERRIFLRGLGGACVAAPFLSSLGGRSVRAEASAAPRRLIILFTHYGCITTRFFPVKSHGPLSADDLASTTLAPLAPYVDKLLMPRGMRAMNEWTSEMLRGQGNDPYLQVCGSYFSCQPVTPNSDDPFSFASDTKFQAKPMGRTLDHVIAEQLSPSGEPLFMRVGNGSDSPASAISYSAAQTGYAGMGSIAEIFGTLTGIFPGASTPDGYAFARGKSVTDLVRDDLETLERFDMSESDRQKLEAWKALLNDTGQVVGSAECNEETAELFGLTQSNFNAVEQVRSDGNGDVLSTRISGTLDGADLYSGLAALAAVCNVNPVIVLKYRPSYVYRGLGIESECTSLSHRLDNASLTGTCAEDVLAKLLKIDDFYARKFAHLVELLNSIDEGDGKVLDNTATVWFQENSDGCAFNLNNLPIVQAGGMGGHFKTGWAVNVEDGSADLTRGNSEAFCAPGGNMQVDALSQETGTDPKLANAPINKYFCNLMNALGVKAGEDGFPSKTGQAEVTHYGRYDKTEDFIGGDVNEPRIHDPGEFSELKA